LALALSEPGPEPSGGPERAPAGMQIYAWIIVGSRGTRRDPFDIKAKPTRLAAWRGRLAAERVYANRPGGPNSLRSSKFTGNSRPAELRAVQGHPISAEPPKIMLMPISNPSAHVAEPGRPCRMTRQYQVDDAACQHPTPIAPIARACVRGEILSWRRLRSRKAR